MTRTSLVLTLVAWVFPTCSFGQTRAPVTPEQVRLSIERGVAYLKQQHNRTNGHWPEHEQQPGGLTSLCVLALLNSGVSPKDPVVQSALEYLRTLDNPRSTYAVALQTMAFATAEPDKDRLLITRNVRWLESTQLTGDRRNGAWGYSDREGKGDNSNSQFALLALHEAERTGIRVSDITWRRAQQYWLKQQKDDGSWGYYEEVPSTGSMTCAGIASLVITNGRLSRGDADYANGTVQCCREQNPNDAVEKGLEWLGQKFSVALNPSPFGGLGAQISRGWWLYYLYGVERVGRLTGRRFFYSTGRNGREAHDWYREGAEYLVQEQDKLTGQWKGFVNAETNPLVGTSFALLFLSKGRWPVVVAKLKHGEGQDWDRHRSGIHNLTRFVERRWGRDMTWQTIDVNGATVEDLLQAPVLFLSGRDGLTLTGAQKKLLRDYVNAGGFLFAEGCCGGTGFDRDFRQFVAEVFPEGTLRLLPPDHAVWFAEQPVDSRYLRPLWGVDACCRTSVVYCPANLGCYWELSPGTRESEAPPAIRDEIEACLRIGANVLAYATGRQLKDKLETPKPPPERNASAGPLSRGSVHLPKLAHGGGSDDAPSALRNLLDTLTTQAAVPVKHQARLASPLDANLFEYPILFLHGRRDFRFSPEERQALARYLENGGFLFADAICASGEFATAFRREMQALFGQGLVKLPAGHPLFTAEFRGYDLSTVTLRDPQSRSGDEPLQARLTKAAPVLEGLERDGRLVAVLSPLDLSCALENAASLECKGYVKDDAARIGINVILFALQQ